MTNVTAGRDVPGAGAAAVSLSDLVEWHVLPAVDYPGSGISLSCSETGRDPEDPTA
ncbi:hypothetical protein ACFV4F_12550 [Kitasatospora sp. NPDC059722]|uniref:hypothetical protein n=1 Tax=Kitasatospora sp. NPDC059722 TaxID=3346925 RepID=UPI0036CE0455